MKHIEDDKEPPAPTPRPGPSVLGTASAMASPQIPQGGSFSLFPNTTASPPRRQTPRPSTSSSSPVENPPHPVVIPGPYANATQSPPPQRRPTPQARVASPAQQPEPRQWGPSRAESSTPGVQQPRQAADVPGRSETAFSQAQTLVLRSASTRSRSSIAKKPLDDEHAPGDEPPVRSMFPRYNPEVPLNQQSYYPTARSPTHIPRAVISRPLYSPEPVTPSSPPPPIDGALARAQEGAQQWPPAPGAHAAGPPPPLPTVSSTEELKGLWKATNGWKASQSEGTVFCLKMTQERDAPVYTLSSTNQAFYNLRVDPTSASAYITLSRHDPSKACRGPPPSISAASPTTPSSIRSRKSQAKAGWHEVLSTALEEEPRRHRPNDGLVAELCPAAALRMAIDKPEDEGAAVLAEQECARLVWDDDSASHYLVHPALATPFCVTAERHPAWGRVEYTLEHHESPNHLARLTRDASGAGYLEVDTGLASKIETFFVLDVAVAALLIVASGDKSFVPTESFEPPPAPAAVVPDGLSMRSAAPEAPPKAARKWGRKTRMENMEIQDVESQESYGAPKAKKGRRVKGDRIRDGLPWPVRIAVTPGIWLGKAVLWCVTTFLKVVIWMVKGLAKALGLIGTTK